MNYLKHAEPSNEAQDPNRRNLSVIIWWHVSRLNVVSLVFFHSVKAEEAIKFSGIIGFSIFVIAFAKVPIKCWSLRFPTMYL